jgi:hypothetical protein
VKKLVLLAAFLGVSPALAQAKGDLQAPAKQPAAATHAELKAAPVTDKRAFPALKK